MLALAIVLVIAGYGFDYYTLGSADRPFSPKHDMLRPSGTIGMKLGMFGVFLFFLIYLYPLRKKWGWLGRQGNARHWLDFHVVLGTAAPLIIAFHASFKFGNIAGMAFFSMLCVTLSGFIGRYLYAQIPRRVNAAELSMKELEEMEESMRARLAEQKLAFGSRLEALYDLPTREEVAHMPMILALARMIWIDLKRPLPALVPGCLLWVASAGLRTSSSNMPWTLPANKPRFPSASCFSLARNRSLTCGTWCTAPSAMPSRFSRSYTSALLFRWAIAFSSQLTSGFRSSNWF
jgi:hypothetical protein